MINNKPVKVPHFVQIAKPRGGEMPKVAKRFLTAATAWRIIREDNVLLMDWCAGNVAGEVIFRAVDFSETDTRSAMLHRQTFAPLGPRDQSPRHLLGQMYIDHTRTVPSGTWSHQHITKPIIHKLITMIKAKQKQNRKSYRHRHLPVLPSALCTNSVRHTNLYSNGFPTEDPGKDGIPHHGGKQTYLVLHRYGSGSDANLIPPRVFDELQKRLGRAIPLQQDNDDTISDLPKLVFGHTSICNERVYIVNNEKSPNLLSEEACLALGLITYGPGGKFIRSTKLQPPTNQKPNLPSLCGLKPALKQAVDMYIKDLGN